MDIGRTPGVTIQYRIKAMRRGISSGYSPTATIFAEGWQAPLQLAA